MFVDVFEWTEVVSCSGTDFCTCPVPFGGDSFLVTRFVEASYFVKEGATFGNEVLGVDEGLSFLCVLKYFAASSLESKLFQTASG